MTTASTPSTETVQLEPSFTLPIALIVLAVPLVWVQTGLGAIVGLFGLFLMVQAATLRLRFTPTALELYRGETRLRHFPYAEWQHWEIFWAKLPILFYFREVKSIHFLPILFDPKQLRVCLEQRCPRLASPTAQ